MLTPLNLTPLNLTQLKKPPEESESETKQCQYKHPLSNINAGEFLKDIISTYHGYYREDGCKVKEYWEKMGPTLHQLLKEKRVNHATLADATHELLKKSADNSIIHTDLSTSNICQVEAARTVTSTRGNTPSTIGNTRLKLKYVDADSVVSCNLEQTKAHVLTQADRKDLVCENPIKIARGTSAEVYKCADNLVRRIKNTDTEHITASHNFCKYLQGTEPSMIKSYPTYLYVVSIIQLLTAKNTNFFGEGAFPPPRTSTASSGAAAAQTLRASLSSAREMLGRTWQMATAPPRRVPATSSIVSDGKVVKKDKSATYVPIPYIQYMVLYASKALDQLQTQVPGEEYMYCQKKILEQMELLAQSDLQYLNKSGVLFKYIIDHLFKFYCAYREQYADIGPGILCI